MADASKATADVSEDANRKQANTLRRKQNEYVDFAAEVREMVAGEKLRIRIVRDNFKMDIKDLREKVRETATARKGKMPNEIVKVLDAAGNVVALDGPGQKKLSLSKRLAMIESSLRSIFTDLDRSTGGIFNTMLNVVQSKHSQVMDDVADGQSRIDAAARKAGYKDFRDASVKYGGAAGDASVQRVTVELVRKDGSKHKLGLPMYTAGYLRSLWYDGEANPKLAGGATLRLIKGGDSYRLDQETVDAIDDAMGKDMVAFTEFLRTVSKNTKAAFDAAQAATGKAPPLIDNQVSTSRDPTGLEGTPKQMAGGNTAGNESAMTVLNLPMLKERAPNTPAPYLAMNMWDVGMRKLHDEAVVAHLAIPLLTLEQSTKTGPGAKALQQRYGDRVLKTVSRFVQAVAGADAEQTGLNKFVLDAERKKRKALVGTIRNLLMNLGGSARVIGEVQALDWAKGFKGMRLSVLEEVLKESSLARSRMRTKYATAITQTAGDTGTVPDAQGKNRPDFINWRQTLSAIGEFGRSVKQGRVTDAWFRNLNDISDGYNLPQMVDGLVMAHLWEAKKAESRRKGLTGQALTTRTREEFERSLANVIPSGFAGDMSGIKLASRNNAGSLFFGFTGDSSSMFQQLSQAYALRNEPGGKGRLSRVVSGFVANAAWSSLMQVLVRRRVLLAPKLVLVVLGLVRGNDEEDKEARKIREAALGRLSDAIPGIVGGSVASNTKNVALNALRNALGDEQRLLKEKPSSYLPQEGSMIFSTMNAMIEAFDNFGKAIAADDSERMAKGMLAAMETVLREALLSSGISDDILDPIDATIEMLSDGK
jgi:hypothetical protein